MSLLKVEEEFIVELNEYPSIYLLSTQHYPHSIQLTITTSTKTLIDSFSIVTGFDVKFIVSVCCLFGCYYSFQFNCNSFHFISLLFLSYNIFFCCMCNLIDLL